MVVPRARGKKESPQSRVRGEIPIDPHHHLLKMGVELGTL
jgi:hypothetical protein